MDHKSVKKLYRCVFDFTELSNSDFEFEWGVHTIASISRKILQQIK